MSLDLHRNVTIGGRLLILNHFPKSRAAEHELVVRLSEAAHELGWITSTLDVSADLKNSVLMKAEMDVDLVLDIHYEYPKFLKPRSIGAFWTPTYFMKFWDFGYVWENQLSHDQIAYTGSSLIKELVEMHRSDANLEVLNHSLPKSWLTWIDETPRNPIPDAFYAGINWDKLSGRMGRHHDFFKDLDDEGILSIYGPKKLGHINPWHGFQSYRGEIPFDGKSLFKKARESGISLIISSEQHISENIMSNRLFEGLAAGNVIIADEHEFVREHLGNNAYYLDFSRGDLYAAKQLRKIIEDLRANPKELLERQDFARDYFSKHFDLTIQLSKLLVKPPEQRVDQEISALVLGSSDTDLRGQLTSIGFSDIRSVKATIFDFQDLVLLAKSLALRNFVILNGNAELLDSFAERLNTLQSDVTEACVGIGVLATTAIHQGSRLFAPVILSRGSLGQLPLNGLLVNLDIWESSQDDNVLVDRVSSLRLNQASDLTYINAMRDTYQELMDLGREFAINSDSIRSNFTNRRNRLFASAVTSSDVLSLPRSQKRQLLYGLLASAPGMKPFIRPVKWFLRRTQR
jgi:hypothetical protein